MIPHATEKLDDWIARRARAGTMLVALDFDGTLAPIVDRPEDVAQLPACAESVRRLAERADTLVAVVSGRALADVRGRVALEGLYYAGNHGMEIEGPDLERTVEEAREARPRLEECARSLQRELSGYDGVLLEDKGLTLSVHYRLVREDGRARVRQAILDTCGGRPGLRLTEGKMVVEVRPDVDWHKGHAVAFLLDLLSPGEDMPAIYVGDDVTDEDAFRALRGLGDGVLVDPAPPPDTAASAFLRSPAEVADLLAALAGSR